jgi:hypothetical protein
MDEHTQQPTRRASVMRVLAAALSGAIGAFGIPAAAHAAQPAVPAITSAPAALAPDTTPE